MYETSIVRSLFKKDNYLKYRNYIPDKVFAKEMKPLLDVVDNYYKTHTEDLDPDDFVNYFFASNNHNIDFYKGVVNSIVSKPITESMIALLEGFVQRDLAERISVAAYEVAEGKKSFSSLLTLMSQADVPVVEEELDYVTDDLDAILDGKVLVPGLRWRLNTLNQALGSLRKGNFGYIFARPETGKTTFLASEVTFMAEQLKDDDPPILWFNNEEVGENVKIRIWQAAIGWTLDEIKKNREEAKQLFREVTRNKIKLIDKTPMDRHTVERYIKATGASLIVIDQLDKINGFKADREDLKLGEVYIWAREIAKGNCPVIGVCQADGTAEGVLWLNMGHTANSKTSKSAEADWIMGIGRETDAGREMIRGITICKNKLVGDEDTNPDWRHLKREVLIHPLVARYADA